MINTYRHKCKGTCSVYVDISYDENDIITSILFFGGCPGNLKGIVALSIGHSLIEIRDKVKGIRCGNKSTSCPNELALGIEEILSAR